MSWRELATMALQNLWARKSRTAFNIFGIVISCSMLLLVFAGSRGAREGLQRLFQNSDFAKQIAIRQGRRQTSDGSAKPPNVSFHGVAADRKERIDERLTKAWESKNLPIVRIDLNRLDTLRSETSLTSVLPNQYLSTLLILGDQKVSTKVGCFSAKTSGLDERIVAGSVPDEDNSIGKIWINEFFAWRLGYRTDQQLEDLPGQTVTLRFARPNANVSSNIKRIASLLGMRNVDEAEQVAEALRKLFADADQTSLTEIEKEFLQIAATRLGLDTKVDLSKQAIAPNDSGTTDPFVYRDFVIGGIVRQPDRSVGDLFQLARPSTGSDLLIHWQDFHEVEQTIVPNRIYYYCVGAVENTSALRQAVEEIESTGLLTRSALEILDRADEELGKVRLIVASIAIVILLIATVGIMNTMIISVMERTPEFGIMKAIGAKDSDVRRLVLVESALTGALGAIVSLFVARGVDVIVSRFARQYIEKRIRGEFDFSVFVYSFSDAIIVVSIAVVICMMASLIPARRAARLDPVDAMKNR